MKWKKIFPIVLTVMVMITFCSLTAFAGGEVANAVENTWNAAKG